MEILRLCNQVALKVKNFKLVHSADWLDKLVQFFEFVVAQIESAQLAQICDFFYRR